MVILFELCPFSERTLSRFPNFVHRLHPIQTRYPALNIAIEKSPAAKQSAAKPATDWSVEQSMAQYAVDRWGDGYFSINEDGNMQVSGGHGQTGIDLHELIESLKSQGLRPPLLIRFNDILRDRVKRLDESFRNAIEEYNYQNKYQFVYPIKVNQQHEVALQIVSEGSKRGFGIEAGSKPELMAAIAISCERTPIVCNGFKDESFIRLALLTQRMGRTVIPIAEKASEIELILRIAKELGVRPSFGMRVKLAARGTGRWQDSGGYRSKFGLTLPEVVEVLDRLSQSGDEDCFELLHFHAGSQIGNIRQLKLALIEAARIYTSLCGRGAKLKYLDVGGGLGVDYDGSQSDTQSSLNYTMQEYANDVVHHIKTVCDDADVPHPILLSESGRAVAAHHSVLVLETISVTEQGHSKLPGWIRDGLPSNYAPALQDLWGAYKTVDSNSMLEAFHDAQAALDLCIGQFNSGHLPLEQRVAAETLYFAFCQKAMQWRETVDRVPDDLQQLTSLLSDIYFVNGSIFQSLPDAWAIGQMFPVVPIQRLAERPTRQAVIGDITCDSDGKLNCFIGPNGNTETIQLHEFRKGESYCLGFFMVGAYQEILGDLHNLFGDTDAIHIDIVDGRAEVESIVHGDTVSEVLGYVQYDRDDLMQRYTEMVNKSQGQQLISRQQADETMKCFQLALAGTTYLT